MTDTDYIQRFLFESSHVRGERVHLGASLQAALATHPYPANIQKLLGELAAVAVLLSSTLKFTGTFTLQARSNGPVTLLMVECTDQHHFRAIARYKEDITYENASLNNLLPQGQLLISTDPAKGKRYQSVVLLNQPTLADCFTTYFRQSEQLPTRLWITCDGQCASGLLLQTLPIHQDVANSEVQQKEAHQWEHAIIMASTVKDEELLTLSNPALLHRLFNEDDIRLFDALPVTYQCTCSRQRTAQSLISLGITELSHMAKEEKPVELQCQFCNKKYTYTHNDIQSLLNKLN